MGTTSEAVGLGRSQAKIKRESEMSMESSAPINIPGKSWLKDNNSSFSSNSPSLSSSFGHQEMSSLTSSPVTPASTHQAAQTAPPHPAQLPSTPPSAPAP